MATNPLNGAGAPGATTPTKSRSTSRARKAWARRAVDSMLLRCLSDTLRTSMPLAVFSVGDTVLFVRDGADHSELAVVVSGYKQHNVLEDDGPYIGSNGQRYALRHGYVIQPDGTNDHCFAAAHRLMREDCKPSHLRLATSRPAAR